MAPAQGTERLEKLNRRIKAKLAELKDDEAERRQAAAVLARKEARIDDLREELRKVRKRIQRRRDAIAEVIADLEDVEASTPDEDTAEEVDLRAQRDQLAGEIEEAIATRERLLDRLDRLKDKHEDARQALEEIVAESKDDRDALERMRARRKRIQDAREKNDRPSPNFDWAEFDCNDGTPLPEASKPAVRHWCQTVGEPVRAQYGRVRINSAFRPEDYNARIGGEDNSVHIYNLPGRDHKAAAVDFSCERGTPADWYAFTAGKADGRGLYNTFHHTDSRNRIGWPDATWRG